MKTARDFYDKAVEAGAVPPDITEAEVVDSIIQTLETDMLEVAPGQEREWDFVLRKGDEQHRVAVSFQSVSSFGSTFGATGMIRIMQNGKILIEHAIGENDAGRVNFEIPAGTLSPGMMGVVYQNTSDGILVLIHHGEAMVASVPGGGVVKNLVLCAAALLSLLSALAGIGVALGALFSFPVAAFTGVAVIFTAFVVGGGAEDAAMDYGHSHGGDPGHSRALELLTHYSVKASRFVAKAQKPFIDANVFDRLGDGVLLDPRLVRASAAQTGILLPLAFGLLAAFVLSRREL